jgi:hypothetical protein
LITRSDEKWKIYNISSHRANGRLATEKEDAHLADFLEREFLENQVKELRELADLATRLERAGPGLGTHIIDTELLTRGGHH